MNFECLFVFAAWIKYPWNVYLLRYVNNMYLECLSSSIREWRVLGMSQSSSLHGSRVHGISQSSSLRGSRVLGMSVFFATCLTCTWNVSVLFAMWITCTWNVSVFFAMWITCTWNVPVFFAMWITCTWNVSICIRYVDYVYLECLYDRSVLFCNTSLYHSIVSPLDEIVRTGRKTTTFLKLRISCVLK